MLCAACVPSYCRISHARAITLSYAGPNTVYCPHTTYDIRQNKRAWSCYHACLFSSLIASNHDNGHVECLMYYYVLQYGGTKIEQGLVVLKHTLHFEVHVHGQL